MAAMVFFRPYYATVAAEMVPFQDSDAHPTGATGFAKIVDGLLAWCIWMTGMKAL